MFMWGNWGPVINPPVGVTLSGGDRVASLDFGADFAVALTDRGHLYTWGGNMHGALGTGDTDARVDPAMVGALARVRVVQFSVGVAHVAAVTEEGEVYTWGENQQGQLGLGDYADRTLPAVVDELATQRNRCQQVACGEYFTCALTRTGRVFAWGKQSGDDEVGRAPTHFIDSNVPQPLKFPGKAVRVRSIACYAQKFAALLGASPHAHGVTSSVKLSAVPATSAEPTPDDFALDAVRESWAEMNKSEKVMHNVASDLRSVEPGAEWTEQELATFAGTLLECLKALVPIQERAEQLHDEFPTSTAAQMFLGYVRARVEHAQLLLQEVREAERARRVGALRFLVEEATAADISPPTNLSAVPEGERREAVKRYVELLRSSAAALHEVVGEAGKLERAVAGDGHLFSSAQAASLVTDLATTRLLLCDLAAQRLRALLAARESEELQAGVSSVDGLHLGRLAHRVVNLAHSVRKTRVTDESYEKLLSDLAAQQEKAKGEGAKGADPASRAGSKVHAALLQLVIDYGQQRRQIHELKQELSGAPKPETKKEKRGLFSLF